MANIKAWQKEIENLAPSERKKIERAIRTLEKWEAFNREFSWTGLFAIGYMLKRQAMSNRNKVSS